MDIAFAFAVIPSVLAACVAAVPLIRSFVKTRRLARARRVLVEAYLEGSNRNLEWMHAQNELLKANIEALREAIAATQHEAEAGQDRADAYESVIDELQTVKKISDDTASQLREEVEKLETSRAQVLEREDKIVASLTNLTD